MTLRERRRRIERAPPPPSAASGAARVCYNESESIVDSSSGRDSQIFARPAPVTAGCYHLGPLASGYACVTGRTGRCRPHKLTALRSASRLSVPWYRNMRRGWGSQDEVRGALGRAAESPTAEPTTLPDSQASLMLVHRTLSWTESARTSLNRRRARRGTSNASRRTTKDVDRRIEAPDPSADRSARVFPYTDSAQVYIAVIAWRSGCHRWMLPAWTAPRGRVPPQQAASAMALQRKAGPLLHPSGFLQAAAGRCVLGQSRALSTLSHAPPSADWEAHRGEAAGEGAGAQKATRAPPAAV